MGGDPDQGRALSMAPSMGLGVFMKRLKKLCPWLRYGYFNPYLGDAAEITAPLPGAWHMPEPDAKGGPDALLAQNERDEQDGDGE